MEIERVGIIHAGIATEYDAKEFYAESVSNCPACGDPIDYCQGHGVMGDPIGASILSAHDDGYHGRCDPDGCEERAEMIRAIPLVGTVFFTDQPSDGLRDKDGRPILP